MSDTTITLSPSPRILISRLGPIGNAILTLPLACALRDRYPDATIGWVVEGTAAPMVRGHEALDVVVELPQNWSRHTRELREVRRLLTAHQFEVSMDPQATFASAFATFLSGAATRIGFASKKQFRSSRLLNNVHVAPAFQHVTDRALELLTPLGIHTPRVRWDLPISDSAFRWAARWRRGISTNRIAILNPGGTWESKLWEPSRFASVSRYLRDRYGYRCIAVWGSEKERKMAEVIVELSEGATLLGPITDIAHLAALISTSDLFISGDTGPLHIAVAVGTATIGLYGATRPGNSGPYGQIAIQKAYQRGSERERSRADNAAMRAIGVDHVCEAIDQLESKRAMQERTVA